MKGLIFLLLCISCAHSTKSNIVDSCNNVALYGNFAYATCDGELVVRDMRSGSKNIKRLNYDADDLAISGPFLFTINMEDEFHMLNISSPLSPKLVDKRDDVEVRFYTGIDANEKFVITSGGLSESTVISYDRDGIKEVKKIAEEEEFFGRPDVSISNSYICRSLDVKLTYKWGIDVLDLKEGGGKKISFISLDDSFSPIKLLSYAPANFPMTCLFYDNQIIFSHFETRSIYSSNIGEKAYATHLKTIDEEVSHMNIFKDSLFIVSKEIKNGFYSFDLNNRTLEFIKVKEISTPTNIVANERFIAVADLDEGLITLVNSKY